MNVFFFNNTRTAGGYFRPRPFFFDNEKRRPVAPQNLEHLSTQQLQTMCENVDPECVNLRVRLGYDLSIVLKLSHAELMLPLKLSSQLSALHTFYERFKRTHL